MARGDTTSKEPPPASTAVRPYEMRISRLTVDKLGVKLYDKVSAAVAELIANAYDADAETVWVRLPLNTVLATRAPDGNTTTSSYFIEVEDDGHGMTPDEAIDLYLQVGRDRRKQQSQGGLSRTKRRPVLGRKGIGKLAPFGICQRIEVLSAGGPRTSSGHLVTHFTMDFDEILDDNEEPAVFDPGPLDRTWREQAGTTIRLSCFLPKRVPEADTFHRQLATRFVLARQDFVIQVCDTRDTQSNPPRSVSPISLPLQDGTHIDLASRPVRTDSGQSLQVSGWLGMARDSYKHEELAGVRLYARGKIVGATRDFEQPAGFTGEFALRSYLVGEVHADWLDLDDGEDLIRTDRQSILWDSDYGQALRKWGAELIKEIAAISREPRRKRVSAIFLEKSDIEARAKARFGDADVAAVAVDLAKQIGAFAAEDELEDRTYVEDLSQVILSVAPHRALIEAFQEFNNKINQDSVPIERLIDLFDKTRVAEMASYSQIASERVRVIRELEGLVQRGNVSEGDFQKLISDAPWLIEPTWSVISKNQSLRTFKSSFEAYWKRRHNEDVVLSIGYETRRPDFTLVSVGNMLHVVEIKNAGHTFNDTDFERLIRYVFAFREFFAENDILASEFRGGWRIDLIADAVSLTTLSNRASFESFETALEVKRVTWVDFLTRAKTAHEAFLDISVQASERAALLGNVPPRLTG